MSEKPKKPRSSTPTAPEAQQPADKPETPTPPAEKPAAAEVAAEAPTANVAPGEGGGSGPAETAEPAAPVGARPAPAVKSPRRGGTGLALLALLVALAAAGGGYWLWTQLERQRMAAQQDNQAMQGRLAQLVSEQKELATRLGLATTALDQVHADTRLLTDALNKINDRLGRDRQAWVVAEAEYLLQLANRRLLLERDVAGAIAALSAADQRLAALNDPLLTRTRARISEELAALRALPPLDVEGIALELGALSKAVDGLVLAGGPRAEATVETAGEEEETSGWRALMGKMWADIRGLVEVRHHEAGSLPLLTPDQRLLLRQNLRLKLETARLALLRGQGPIYLAALQEADEWVERFYDSESAATVGMREALGRLAAIDIAPELPAIEQSLHALREVGTSPEAEEGEQP